MKHWPLNKAWFWETAPFFRVLVPFVAGIICFDKGWFAPIGSGSFVFIIAFAFILVLAIIFSGKTTKGLHLATFALVFIMLLSAGAGVSFLSDVRNDNNWFGNDLSNGNTYLARITDIPTEKEHSWKVPLNMISSVNNGKVVPATGHAFLYLYKDASPMLLHKGDSILVPGKWHPIKNAGNPFEFDYATYCRRNGLFYQQTCSVNEIRLYSTNDPGTISLLEKAHDFCMLQLNKYITEPTTKGLIQAMILGDEVNLDEELRQSYADTGIIHIIAISGGNVAIFFVAISFLLWWLRHKQHLWIKYAIALPLVWFYVLMAGAAPSAIRAAIMFSLLAFAVMLEKNNNSLNQLFATAFLLLCAEPMWLFSVGFQLSFVAVLSLILFYKPVYAWLSPVNKATQLLWGTAAASIAAEVLVAPLVVYYFHTFPLLFVVANAVAYLFMSVVLIMGMGVIVLSFLPAVSNMIGRAIVGIVTVFDKIVVWLQGLSPRSFHFLVLNGIELCILYVVIGGFTVFLMKKQKAALFTGLCACCLLFLSFCGNEWSRLHQQRLVVYNTTKVNHTELIRNDMYVLINTDTSARKKINYVVTPAHTGWQAWKQDTPASSDIFSVRGKTVLVLKDDIITDKQFPVDILVIDSIPNPDIPKLHNIFSPSLIVLGNGYSAKQQEKLIRMCEQESITCHSVSLNGAFVLN